MKTFYSTQLSLPLPPGHRFPMGKYAALRDRLAAECEGLRLAQAPPARPELCGSTTVNANMIAMAASVELPPRRRISAPASAARGSAALIRP